MKKLLLASASLFLLGSSAFAQQYPYYNRDPKGECLGVFQQQQAVQAKWAGPIRDVYLRNQANTEVRAAFQATNNCLQALYNRQAEEGRQRFLQDQAARQAEMKRQADEARASQERIAAENRARAEAEIAAKEREQNRWHEEREAERAKRQQEGKADTTVPECGDEEVLGIVGSLMHDQVDKAIDRLSDYQLTQAFIQDAQQSGVALKGPNDIPSPKELRERYLDAFHSVHVTFSNAQFGGVTQASNRYTCRANTHAEGFDIFDKKSTKEGFINYTIEMVDGRPLVSLPN